MATILIIDDDADMTELIAFKLGAQGHNIVTAGDGEEGLEAIRDERPDLVILDHMMPLMTGLEVLQEVRGDPEIKDTQIIMLTAKAMEDDIVKALEIGANDYVAKPFSIRELLARVQRALA